MKASKVWMDIGRHNDLTATHKGLTADQNKLRLMQLDGVMFGKPAREDVRDSILETRFDRLVKAVRS